MLRTIFLTASQGDEGKNFEHVMRTIFLSRYSDLKLMVTSKADFDRYLTPATETVRAPFAGKFGLIVFSTYWLWKRRDSLNEVILISEPTVVGIVGCIAKLFANIRWVVDVWDIPIRHVPYRKDRNRLTELRIALTRFLMKLAYQRADLFIVGIRPDFQFRYFRVPQAKILAWQTTIWVPEAREVPPEQEDGGFNIICMKSSHTFECGLDVLLRAFSRVKRELPQARLWIIGKVREDAEASIREFRTLEGVEFFGFLEHARLMALIREAHLCVIPWRDEVDVTQLYPTKVMEYMTEGKLVLAAGVAGISDMIRDGEDGLLHRPGDPDDLAAKILMLYPDRALRRRLTENARKYHERFDTVRKHEEIFRVLQGMVHDAPALDLQGIRGEFS